MDELEAVWGPTGRATVDPSSVRAVAPREPAPAVAAPRPPDRSADGGDGNVLPAPDTRARVPVLVAAALAVALVAAVGGVALGAVGLDDGAAPAAPTPVTATTIVSAAADLLGRGTTTTRPPRSASTTAVPPPPAAVAGAPAPSTSAPPTSAPAPARPTRRSSGDGTAPPLVEAERVAQRFIDVIHQRDCEALWSLLGRTTQAFLLSRDGSEGADGRTLLCDGLRSEPELPPIAVRGPAVARADGAAVVSLEWQGELEDLVLVAEEGRWVIDLFGETAESS